MLKIYLCPVLLFAASAAFAQAPFCTLSTASSTVSPEGVFILNSTCTPAATSFNWTGPGVPATTSVGSVLGTAPTQAGSYTFTVIGRNTAGAGAPAAVTLTVGSSTPPPVVVTPPTVPGPTTPAPAVPLASVCSASYVRPVALTISPFAFNSVPVTATMMGTENFAWSFVAPANLKVARVAMTSDNYIDGKDFSISPCPGDFALTLPKECVSRLMGSTMLMLDVGGSQQRCHLTAGATYYFNVRMSYPAGSIVELIGRAYF